MNYWWFIIPAFYIVVMLAITVVMGWLVIDGWNEARFYKRAWKAAGYGYIRKNN